MKKRSYRQLTPEERRTIQIMRQAGGRQAEVAGALVRAASMVSRELRRNWGGEEACLHASAQMRARERRACRRGHRARSQAVWPTTCWLLKEGFTAGQIRLLAMELLERTVYRLIALVRVSARCELGQWEADLVDGLDARSFLLVLRQRKRRLCRIVLIFDQRAEAVANALMRELTPFPATFRSLIVDNGGEFVRARARRRRPQTPQLRLLCPAQV